MSGRVSFLDRVPYIALYLISANRSGYLIAKTLALGGCRVWVRVEISPTELKTLEQPGPAEREYCSWLFSEEQIQVVDTADEIPEMDCLLYDVGQPRPRYPEDLRAFIAKARHVVAWNTNDHELVWWRNLRAELASLFRFAQFVPSTNQTVMSSGRTFLRPTAMFRSSRRQGYFVHPKFLREPDLRAEMFRVDLSGQARRPVRLIFSGNPQPQTRLDLVEELKQFLLSRPDVRLVNHYEDIGTASALSQVDKALVLWMMRSDPNDPRWYLRHDVVPPEKWPQVMRLCDFAFCPPGYELKTHRVVESLLQGVIPILDCPEEYDLNLQDGVNCLTVRGGLWREAVQRALVFSTEDVARMRESVISIALNQLHPIAASRHWLSRMGLPGTAHRAKT